MELVYLHFTVKLSEVALFMEDVCDYSVVNSILTEHLKEYMVYIPVNKKPGTSHTVLSHVIHATPKHFLNCILQFSIRMHHHTTLTPQLHTYLL